MFSCVLSVLCPSLARLSLPVALLHQRSEARKHVRPILRSRGSVVRRASVGTESARQHMRGNASERHRRVRPAATHLIPER